MSVDFSEIQELIDEDVLQSFPDKELVVNKLENLIDSGFLKRTSVTDYIFKDHVTWEIVYETLLYSERRHFHDLIARHIEKNKMSNLNVYAAKLVYHYEKGENDRKVVFYAAMAGDRAYELFSIEDALGFFNKALLHLISINKYPKNDHCLLMEKKGDIMESITEFPEAIELYKESLSTLDNSTSSRRTFLPWRIEIKKKKSEILHKLSAIYERMMEFDKCINYLQSAEKYLPPRPGVLIEKINATLGVVFLRRLEYEKSTKHALISLKRAKKSGSLTGVAYANNILANIYTNTGRYKDAITSYEKALEIYRSIKDLTGISRTCLNIGGTLANLMQVEESIKYMQESLEASSKIQNKLTMMYCYLSLGVSNLQLSNHDDSMVLFGKVIELYESGVKRKDIYGIALLKISEIYMSAGDFEPSEHYLEKATSILSEIKDMPDKLQQAKITFIKLRIKQENYDDAKKICQDLLDELSQEKANAMLLFVMRLMGTICNQTDEYAEAENILLEAIKLSENMGAKYECLCLENILYNVYARRGSHDKSIFNNVEVLMKKFKEKNDVVESELAKNTMSLLAENKK